MAAGTFLCGCVKKRERRAGRATSSLAVLCCRSLFCLGGASRRLLLRRIIITDQSREKNQPDTRSAELDSMPTNGGRAGSSPPKGSNGGSGVGVVLTEEVTEVDRGAMRKPFACATSLVENSDGWGSCSWKNGLKTDWGTFRYITNHCRMWNDAQRHADQCLRTNSTRFVIRHDPTINGSSAQ
jgi:hypothetical protein